MALVNRVKPASFGTTATFRRSWWAALFALILSTGLVACGSDDVGTSASAAISAPNVTTITKHATASVLITSEVTGLTKEITSVRVSPSSVVLDPGETAVLTARGFASDGSPVDDLEIVWAVVDSRSGSVTSDGLVTAGVTPGAFRDALTVTAVQNTALGIRYASAMIPVTVVGEHPVAKIASVAILPDGPSVLAGQIYRFRAAAFDQSGLVIPGVGFVWEVNDPGIGRMNDIGYLTVEGKPGIFKEAVTVTAIWEGARVAGSTDVTILRTPKEDGFLRVQILPQRFLLDPGDRLRLRAVALNGLGELVSGTQLRWNVSDPQVGTVDGRGWFVAGDSPGIYTEAIRVEAVVPSESGVARAEDLASVVIRRGGKLRRLENVRVLPQPVIVTPGGRALMRAQAVDELGLPADEAEVRWEVVQKGVGQIDENGAFTSGDVPGLYREALLVTVEQRHADGVISRSDLVDVIVTGAMSQLEVHPALATIAPGRIVHYGLSGWDENGMELPGLVVKWSVSSKGVGSIDPFGNFTAGQAPGMYPNAIEAEVIQTLPNVGY